MSAETDSARLPDEVVAEEFYIALQHAYRALREKFLAQRENKGVTQKLIAERLGWDKALVSRRLHGRANLTFKTMSALATAMESRLKIDFISYDEMAASNYRYEDRLLEERSFGTVAEIANKADDSSSTPRAKLIIRHTRKDGI